MHELRLPRTRCLFSHHALQLHFSLNGPPLACRSKELQSRICSERFAILGRQISPARASGRAGERETDRERRKVRNSDTRVTRTANCTDVQSKTSSPSHSSRWPEVQQHLQIRAFTFHHHHHRHHHRLLFYIRDNVRLIALLLCDTCIKAKATAADSKSDMRLDRAVTKQRA